MKRGAGELFATHRVILIEHVIDPMDDGFSLDDIYHALDIIAEHQDVRGKLFLQLHGNKFFHCTVSRFFTAW